MDGRLGHDGIFFDSFTTGQFTFKHIAYSTRTEKSIFNYVVINYTDNKITGLNIIRAKSNHWFDGAGPYNIDKLDISDNNNNIIIKCRKQKVTEGWRQHIYIYPSTFVLNMEEMPWQVKKLFKRLYFKGKKVNDLFTYIPLKSKTELIF